MGGVIDDARTTAGGKKVNPLFLLIPGFSQGFAQKKQREQTQEQATKSKLFAAVLNDPTLARAPGIQKELKGLVDPETIEGLGQLGEMREAGGAAQQFLSGKAGQAPPIETQQQEDVAVQQAQQAGTPFQALSSQFGGGPTSALATPTGRVVVSGEQGVRQPILPGALAGGEREVTQRVDPKTGLVTPTFGPTPSAEKVRRGEKKFRDLFRQQSKIFRNAGFQRAEADARAAAIAADTPGTIAPTTGPVAEALREVAIFEQRGQATPSGALSQAVGAAATTPGQAGAPAPGVPVPATIAEIKAQRAGEQTAARERQTFRRKTLSQSKQVFVDPNTLETLAPSSTVGAALDAGAREITQTEKKALTNIRGMDDFIKRIDKISSTLFPSDDPGDIARRALLYQSPGFSKGLAKGLGFPANSPEALAVRDLNALRAEIPKLARVISQETGGRLSDFDVQNVFASIPGNPEAGLLGGAFFESKSSSQSLIQNMRTQTEDMKRNFLGLPRPEPAAGTPIQPGETIPLGQQGFSLR